MMWRQSISLALLLCFEIPFRVVAAPLSLKHTDISSSAADMRRSDPRARERSEEREQSEGDLATDKIKTEREHKGGV